MNLFSSITQTLDNLARHPQLLLPIRNSPDNPEMQMGGPQPQNLSSSSSSTHTQIPSGQQQQVMDSTVGRGATIGFIGTDLWLESIKMGRYSQHFKEAGLESAQQVS